jgi:hypothetical protein
MADESESNSDGDMSEDTRGLVLRPRETLLGELYEEEVSSKDVSKVYANESSEEDWPKGEDGWSPRQTSPRQRKKAVLWPGTLK